MSDFRSSSQRERWIFQPHDLVERWTAANQRAATYLAHVGSYGTTRLKVDEHGCSDNPPDRGYSYNIFQEILSTLDLLMIWREDNGALKRLKELRQTGISYNDKVMLTDAPLIYTPGQLALAALHKSNDILGVFDFERYLETIFSRQHSDCTVEEFVQSLNAIHYLVDQLNIPTNKDMRYVDRKLKHCWDPSSHDEHKKKEKKSKHKSKRTSSDAQL